MQEIVREVLLDEIPLISATNDEVVDSVLRIHLENVPQDRSTADLDHRLGACNRFFTEPRPQPARQYDCFHSRPLVLPSPALPKPEAFPFICCLRDIASSPYGTRGVPHCVCLLCDPMIFQAQLRDQLWDCLECHACEYPAEALNFSRSTSIVAAEGNPVREILARASDWQRARELLCDNHPIVDDTVDRK